MSELSAIPTKALLVLDEIDRTDSETLAEAQQAYPDTVFISATERLSLETLRQQLQLVEVVVAPSPLP